MYIFFYPYAYKIELDGSKERIKALRSIYYSSIIFIYTKNISMSDLQTLYQTAIKFAAEKHGRQKVKGSQNPYVVHLSNVAMEIFMAAEHTPDFNLSLAIQAALLHDTIEDTKTMREEIEEHFGEDISDAVWALTKDKSLPKTQRIFDSLTKVKLQPKEVWAVKLADRITNLQPPPWNWSKDHISVYRAESQIILTELREGNSYLAERLAAKIEEYGKYC